MLDESAVEYLNWLETFMSECEMPDSLRTRVAAGCFAIALSHYHAIVVLLDSSMFASVFALVRCEFEAYVRGEWLARCATDAQVVKFSKNDEPPSIKEMLRQLESTPTFTENALTVIKHDSWGAMCGYNHTGGLHVAHWATGPVIEPNYTVEKIKEVLSFVEILGALVVVGLAALANNEGVAQAVLEKVHERTAVKS